MNWLAGRGCTPASRRALSPPPACTTEATGMRRDEDTVVRADAVGRSPAPGLGPFPLPVDGTPVLVGHGRVCGGRAALAARQS
jgi:hypothetical protein